MVANYAYFSPADYLELERDSPIRHEYRLGLVYAMAGGSDFHDRIALNLLTEINLHLRGSDCRFHSGNVKVNYADAFYYYPDAFVTCDPRDFKERYVKRFPKFIAEVLSPSAQTFDRGDKFEDYRQIETLEEYVLISQDLMRVECRRKSQTGWETAVYEIGEQVIFKSLGLELAIEQLYMGVELG